MLRRKMMGIEHEHEHKRFVPPAVLDSAEQLLQLIAILSDRKATKAMLDQLIGASQAAIEAHERLGELQAGHAALAKERERFEKELADERAKLRDAHAMLSADKDQLAADRADHNRAVAEHAARPGSQGTVQAR